MKKISGVLLIYFITVIPVWAQLEIRADLSPRAELRNGYRTMPGEDDKSAGLVHQRTRFSVSFLQDNLRTHLSFQDVRVWGQELQRQDNPSMAIHEAWAELLFSDNLSLKAGRQELRYDNQRFFAINDWIPMGQKHDLALLKYNSNATEMHFGTAFNQPANAFGKNFGTEYLLSNYKYMGFAWLHTPVSDNIQISLLAVADGYEAMTGDALKPDLLYVRGTWSAYTRMALGDVSLMVNPAIQHGKTPQGQDIMAWYLRAEGGGALTTNLRSTLGLEIFSGNDGSYPEDGKFRAFDALYGAGHAHMGFMDYFTQIPQHTRGAGIINPFLKNQFKISDQTQLDADLHLFYIQNNYMHVGTTIDKYLGTEVDLTLSYRFNSYTRIIGGVSAMFGSESMEIIKSGSKDEPAYFAYIMMRIRPRLL